MMKIKILQGEAIKLIKQYTIRHFQSIHGVAKVWLTGWRLTCQLQLCKLPPLKFKGFLLNKLLPQQPRSLKFSWH